MEVQDPGVFLAIKEKLEQKELKEILVIQDQEVMLEIEGCEVVSQQLHIIRSYVHSYVAICYTIKLSHDDLYLAT